MAAHLAEGRTAGAGAPRLAFLPELLEIHFGELQNLWGRRRAALRSRDHSVRTLSALDERIAAHTQGLLVAGRRARALVEPALAGDDPDAAFAAAHAMLRLNDPDAARAVVGAVGDAAPATRRGLAEALAYGPAAAVEPHYAVLAADGRPGVMAVATEVLACRGALRAEDAAAALDVLLTDDDAQVRAAGWRAAAQLGRRVADRHYAAGWADDAPDVRRSALEAAAWAGVPEVVAYGRACAARPSPGALDALYLLAVLAGPEDVPRVAAVACAPGARPAHLALLGPLGSPAHVDHLVAAMADPDPARAAAAGAAFATLTGHAVDSGPAASTAAADADPFDAEFAEIVRLPDQGLAGAAWEAMRPAAATFGRLGRGLDVAGPPDPETLARLDLASRWEWCLRGRFTGVWRGTPADLEALAQDLY